MAFQAFTIKQGSRAANRADFESSDSEEDAQPGPSGRSGTAAGSQSAAQWQEAGNEAAAAGKWSLALRSWDAALAAPPLEAHKLHEAKAQVWLEVGEDWKAVQCAERAVELQPGWAAGHLTLARAQLYMGEPELALQSCKRVLQLEPQHPEAAAEIASIRTLVMRRQQSGAAATGQRALVVTAAADAEVADAPGP